MFFLAKAIGILVLPSTLLWLAVALACVMLWSGRVRAGTSLAGLAFVAWSVIAVLPAAALVSAPLEDRFPRPPDGATPDGIIVLGGAIRPELSALRNQPQLNEAGERMTEFAALALRFPKARLVFSGGSASLWPGAPPESDAARQLLTALGLPPGRVVFEGNSRTTYENAVLSKAEVNPAPGERWLLVTSAMDMPRAVGVFRAAGWPVIAWPVDYHTGAGFGLSFDPAGNLDLLDHAVHEWVGLAAYRILGRTDALLPSP